ncbi:MAG: peptidylprolyl isomerase [Gammaproteobacteria bacterium]
MLKTQTTPRGAARTTLLSAVVLMSTVGCAQSNSDATATAPEVEAKIVDLYVQNRMRGAQTEITEQQRDQLRGEVADLYLMAEEAEAKGLDNDPEVAAQIELQRLSVLASSLAANYLEENPPTEAELRAEYNVQVAGFQPKQYKARHILVETEDEAKGLITELDDGADFVELAIEKSTGPSGPNGGDLGWFPPDSMVKPFSDAVVALDNGAYTSEPVQTQFGWHVILREDSRETDPPSFEEVKDRLRPSVEQKKLQSYLDGLRSTTGG